MGFRGCYQPAVTSSRLRTRSLRRGEAPRRLGNAGSFLAQEWGWDIPNKQLRPADLQTPLLFGSIPTSERFTCLQEIYLRRTQLGHIYNLLSAGSWDNTAVCWRWIIHSGLQPLRHSLLCQESGPRALSPWPCTASSPTPRDCWRAGAAVVGVGCAAQPAFQLFPSKSIYSCRRSAWTARPAKA